MSYITIYQYANFTIFIVFTFFAILQLNQKNKLSLNYYLSGAFFLTGYTFFYYWLFSMGLLKYVPFLINTEICFGFLIGPAIFFYFGALSGSGRYKPLYFIPHMIPFVISSVCIIFLQIINGEGFLNYVTHSVLPDYSHNRYIFIINTFCDSSLAVYMIFTLCNLSIFLRSKKIDYEILLVFLFFILSFINAVLVIIANIINNSIFVIISIGCYAITPAYYSFFTMRRQDFAFNVIRKGKTLRYNRSILKKYDTILIEKRLVQLMEEENIYRRQDLTLKSLSTVLLIQSYELSHILNNRFNANFNTFVNQYRIKEAKKLLLASPEKSIIEIAFSVGFNATSSFYDYFKRYTNISPSEYKKNHPDL